MWPLSKGFCASFILLSPSPSLVGRLNYLTLFEKALGRMPFIYLFNLRSQAFLTDFFGMSGSFSNLITFFLGSIKCWSFSANHQHSVLPQGADKVAVMHMCVCVYLPPKKHSF